MTTSTFKHAAALIAVLVLATPAARAQTAPNPPVSLTVISPIFSQLVRFSSPSDFVPVFENLNGNFYTRESVLKGETAQVWTQMITVTGTKSLAANPTLTPEAYAVSLAGGFKTVCPESFVALPLGAMRFGNQDGFAAIAGCGMVASSADKHSEIALIRHREGNSGFLYDPVGAAWPDLRRKAHNRSSRMAGALAAIVADQAMRHRARRTRALSELREFKIANAGRAHSCCCSPVATMANGGDHDLKPSSILW